MLSTNLSFNGNAREVMDFYADVFGYEITENDIWLDEDGKVAHGEFKIYGNTLMFTDTDEESSFAGFTLSINLTNETELRNCFEKMSVGAEIVMPIGKVDWSECYGLLKDKFGVMWQFNLD